MNEMTVTFENGAANLFRRLKPERLMRDVLDAAAQGMVVRAKEHFMRREAEPPGNGGGFPRFGQSYPKSNFWAGTKGNSVSEKIGRPVIDAAAGEAEIPIDSPALAHKAEPSPPPIRPTGGRRFLAIPANPLAAAWRGMPRDFQVAGGMKFGFSYTPEGRQMPALVANDNYFRRTRRGKNAGGMQLQKEGSAWRAAEGGGKPLFWLVRKVQTRHDPNALPPKAGLENAAFTAAEGVFARLLKRGEQLVASN